MTEPPEEDFGMIFFKRSSTQAQEESSDPISSYGINVPVVDGGLALSIFY